MRYKGLPYDVATGVARSCCRALAPSTLATYLDCIMSFETFGNNPLCGCLPLDENVILKYLGHLRDKGCRASTLNCHLSALGTFSEWAGFPRPRSSLLSYVVKGEARQDALTSVPPKSRVPFFPIDTLLLEARGVVPRLLQSTRKEDILPWACLLLGLIWCTRPSTLMSVRTDKVEIRDN